MREEAHALRALSLKGASLEYEAEMSPQEFWQRKLLLRL